MEASKTYSVDTPFELQTTKEDLKEGKPEVKEENHNQLTLEEVIEVPKKPNNYSFRPRAPFPNPD